jgi:hypothetical protein
MSTPQERTPIPYLYAESARERAEGERLARVETLVERLIKDFAAFFEESRAYRKETADKEQQWRKEITDGMENRYKDIVVEIKTLKKDMDTKHAIYDAIINNQKGKWSVIVFVYGLIGAGLFAVINWGVDYWLRLELHK